MKEEHVEVAAAPKRGVKDFMLAYLDVLVVAGVVVLVALEFLIGLLPLPPVDPVSTELEAGNAKLEAALGAAPKALEQRDRQVEATVAGLRAKLGFVPENPAAAVGVTFPEGWLAAQRSGLSNVILFRAPQALNGSAERGVNQLNWATDPDDNVEPSAFVILRKVDEGAETELARVPAGTTTFEDRRVRAGRSYTYRVRAVTAESTVPIARRMTEPSVPFTLVAATDFRLALIEADREKGSVRLGVEKWHEGAWWPKEFTVREGEPVGGLDSTSGVDYGTGRVLKRLTFEDREESRTLEEPVFESNGQVRVSGGQVVREPKTVRVRIETIEVLLEGGGLPSRTLSLERTP